MIMPVKEPESYFLYSRFSINSSWTKLFRGKNLIYYRFLHKLNSIYTITKNSHDRFPKIELEGALEVMLSDPLIFFLGTRDAETETDLPQVIWKNVAYPELKLRTHYSPLSFITVCL